MKKIDRLFAIVLLLYNKGRLTANEIAETLEFNTRTIYRDIQALSEIGVPIIARTGLNGGYEIGDDYFIPPIMFTKDELLGLMMSESIIKNVDIPGFKGTLQSSYDKVRTIACKDLVDVIENMNNKIIFDIRRSFMEVDDHCIVQDLLNAINDHNILSIRFTGTESKIDFKPYGLIFAHGNWEVVGEEASDHFRRYKLNQILEIERSKSSFDRKSNFELENYYYCRDYSRSKSVPDDYVDIKLTMTPELFNTVKQDVHFVDASVSKSKDKVTLHVETTRPEDYIEFAFKYPDDYEIVSPTVLIDELKTRIKKVQKKY